MELLQRSLSLASSFSSIFRSIIALVYLLYPISFSLFVPVAFFFCFSHLSTFCLAIGCFLWFIALCGCRKVSSFGSWAQWDYLEIFLTASGIHVAIFLWEEVSFIEVFCFLSIALHITTNLYYLYARLPISLSNCSFPTIIIPIFAHV